MAKTKEIKRRMTSITNTRQITSAMKMVSASKLRRAQDMVGAGQPYREKLKAVLARVADSGSDELMNPLLDVRPIAKEGFVVFAADKGLAGGYNNTLLQKALKAVQVAEDAGHEVGIIAIGRKAYEFFNKQGYRIDAAFLETSDLPQSSDSNDITGEVQRRYISGEYDKVTMVYQVFRSAMSQEPAVVPILPIVTEDMVGDVEDEQYEIDYIFEPNAQEILEALLPLYLGNQIHSALTDAKAGEHGARMTAMTAATDNATELLADLKISYNRARQTAITNEISEIVAGADALG